VTETEATDESEGTEEVGAAPDRPRSSGLVVTEVAVDRILTRSSGFLRAVSSHSLQPYRGCTFGRSLCGVGCYVQHSPWVTKGRAWGSFLEVRTNAAAAYRASNARERVWARRRDGRFSIFLSSATDPFVPQEARFGITRSVLEAMIEEPPDALVLQTHGDRVAGAAELCSALARRCDLRVHISVESDLDRLPGLPPPAASVDARLTAAARLRERGVRVVVTVSPLFPIAAPERFFARIADVADAVVIDHYIEGDGSREGARTLRTRLPAAMAALDPDSTGLAYRDRIVAVARAAMPGRVGVSARGFAGVYD
jgi:DNA repair photolyase